MPNEIASEPRIVGSRAFARRDIVVALLVGLLALLVYNANGRADIARDDACPPTPETRLVNLEAEG